MPFILFIFSVNYYEGLNVTVIFHKICGKKSQKTSLFKIIIISGIISLLLSDFYFIFQWFIAKV